MDNTIEKIAEEYGFSVKNDKKTFNGCEKELLVFYKGDSNGAAFLESELDKLSEEEIHSLIKNQVVPAFSALEEYSTEYFYERIRNGDILLCLVNKEKNAEMLKDVPHREFLDLAIVYRVVMDIPENFDGESTVLLDNKIVSDAGVTEQELFERGMNFLRKHMRVTDVIQKSLGEKAYLYPLPSHLFDYDNGMMSWGAAAMLLLPEMETRGYVLPRSIHFVTLFTDERHIEALGKMVEFYNRPVAPEERLSNSVYRIKDGKIEIALQGRPL